MLTQLQHYEMTRRKLAALNEAFMEMVNHPTNPMTRDDLEALIKKRPNIYGRFASWLEKLPRA